MAYTLTCSADHSRSPVTGLPLMVTGHSHRPKVTAALGRSCSHRLTTHATHALVRASTLTQTQPIVNNSITRPSWWRAGGSPWRSHFRKVTMLEPRGLYCWHAGVNWSDNTCGLSRCGISAVKRAKNSTPDILILYERSREPGGRPAPQLHHARVVW